LISWRRLAWSCLLLAPLSASGCIKSIQRSTLTLEQHSLRMQLHVDKDGSIPLSEQPPLTGRVDVRGIFKAEGIPLTSSRSVQGMIYYGRLYLVGEGFRSLWEITPTPGTSVAHYRPFPLAEGQNTPGRGLRLSRYGSARSACLRIDRDDGAPLFLTSRGALAHDCP